MSLITDSELTLCSPDCHPGADWFRGVAVLDSDISEVLPYLNSELEGGEYNKGAMVLIWKCSGKKYAFRHNEITIAPVLDREEALKLLTEIIDKINDIWIRRGDIEPNFEGAKPLPNVLDIYKLLPGKNCRECDFLSCMAFAAALRKDFSKLSLCQYIHESDFIALIS